MKKRAFTLIEILVSIGLVAALASFVFASINIPKVMLNSREARADFELRQIEQAVQYYRLDNGTYPADAGRGLPAGLDPYLGKLNWTRAPFNERSTYDWDNYIGSDGNPARQISIRFCPSDDEENCDFPDAAWASGFDYYSSYYFCIEGRCRAHAGQADDHPGYCVNYN